MDVQAYGTAAISHKNYRSGIGDAGDIQYIAQSYGSAGLLCGERTNTPVKPRVGFYPGENKRNKRMAPAQNCCAGA